jgi:hypothetical protein
LLSGGFNRSEPVLANFSGELDVFVAQGKFCSDQNAVPRLDPLLGECPANVSGADNGYFHCLIILMVCIADDVQIFRALTFGKLLEIIGVKGQFFGNPFFVVFENC